MAEFCRQCTLELRGEDFSDFDLGPLEEGGVRAVLCEGCGFTRVDTRGVCVHTKCPKHGKEKGKMRSLSDSRIVVTGTQVYGPVTSISDIDIVVEEDAAEQIRDSLDTKGVEYQLVKQLRETTTFTNRDIPLYRLSFYFYIGPLKFNIITANDDEDQGIERWRAATKHMLTLAPIKEREERLKVFQSVLNRRA